MTPRVYITSLTLLIFSAGESIGQSVEIDSLKRALATATDDLQKVIVLDNLSYSYVSTSPDTAFMYAQQGLDLANATNNFWGRSACTTDLGNVYFAVGDYPKALELYFQALRLKENLENQNFAVGYFNIATVYTEQGSYRNALDYTLKAMREDERIKDTNGVMFDMYSLGSIYLRMYLADSALYFNERALTAAKEQNDEILLGAIFNNMGEIYLQKNDYRRAASYYRQSLVATAVVDDRQVMAANFLGLAKVHRKHQRPDSAVYYAKKAWRIANESSFLKQAFEAAEFVTAEYKQGGKLDSAFKYFELSVAARDSLFNVESVKKVQNLKLEEQVRQQGIEADALKFRNDVKLFSVLGISVVFLGVAGLLWRNNNQKKRAYAALELQKSKTDAAYVELKSTQAQLIQSEKMASLGELTAGIAHEIQNPLNFVNNFSEVSQELAQDLQSEMAAGNLQPANEIVTDLVQNLQRINHHGKRAGEIVKGMLQHSRTGSGQKESVDINNLLGEYSRLALSGWKVKDKSFDVALVEDFDISAGTMNVMPQELGRVILNLLNNAFYALVEKNKATDGFKPVVRLSTKKEVDKVVIIVSDNGTGIPAGIVDKIFQPFFTTKPTGQGTGLGLSLSYDAIVKGHQGELKVETEQNKGTSFVIILPVK